MHARSACATSLRTLRALRRPSTGPRAGMPCTLGVLPTSLPMSGTCDAPRAARRGRPKPLRCSPVPAVHMASRRRSPPRIMTPPRISTIKRLHLGPPLTSSRFVVRGCSLQTPPTLRRMLLGKSCRIGICIGLPCTQGNPGVGHLNGSACGATPLSMRTIRCCKACLQRPCAPHTAPAGLHWIYASSAAAGSAAAVRPQKFSPALANASCSPNQLSLRPTLLRMSRLHPPPQRTTVPHLPTQPGHAKAPLTRWRVGAHIAGCSCFAACRGRSPSLRCA